MLDRSPAVWIIRAAPGSRLAKAFVDNDVVALGWPNLVGDLRGMTARAIAVELERTSDLPTPNFDAAELVTFRDDVQVGDVVVTPDAAVREFVVGAVADEYEYRTSPSTVDREGPYRHIRRMDWWGRDSRDALPHDLAKMLSWRRTIRRLDRAEEWVALAQQLRTSPRTAQQRGAPKGTERRAGHLAPASSRCTVCKEPRPSSWFAPGSDLCNDCRADL